MIINSWPDTAQLPLDDEEAAARSRRAGLRDEGRELLRRRNSILAAKSLVLATRAVETEKEAASCPLCSRGPLPHDFTANLLGGLDLLEREIDQAIDATRREIEMLNNVLDEPYRSDPAA